MIEIQVTVGGKARITVSGDKIKEVFEQAAFFQSLPTCCPRCKKEKQEAVNYRFAHNQDKDGNSYYKLICDRGHIASLGQHRDGKTLFYKHNDTWQTWQEIKDASGGTTGGQNRQGNANTQNDYPPEPPADAYDDDLPF